MTDVPTARGQIGALSWWVHRQVRSADEAWEQLSGRQLDVQDKRALIGWLTQPGWVPNMSWLRAAMVVALLSGRRLADPWAYVGGVLRNWASPPGVRIPPHHPSTPPQELMLDWAPTYGMGSPTDLATMLLDWQHAPYLANLIGMVEAVWTSMRPGDCRYVRCDPIRRALPAHLSGSTARPTRANLGVAGRLLAELVAPIPCLHPPQGAREPVGCAGGGDPWHVP